MRGIHFLFLPPLPVVVVSPRQMVHGALDLGLVLPGFGPQLGDAAGPQLLGARGPAGWLPPGAAVARLALTAGGGWVFFLLAVSAGGPPGRELGALQLQLPPHFGPSVLEPDLERRDDERRELGMRWIRSESSREIE